MRKAWLGPGLWVTSWGLWWCKEAHTGEVAEAGYPASGYPELYPNSSKLNRPQVGREWKCTLVQKCPIHMCTYSL